MRLFSRNRSGCWTGSLGPRPTIEIFVLRSMKLLQIFIIAGTRSWKWVAFPTPQHFWNISHFLVRMPIVDRRSWDFRSIWNVYCISPPGKRTCSLKVFDGIRRVSEIDRRPTLVHGAFKVFRTRRYQAGCTLALHFKCAYYFLCVCTMLVVCAYFVCTIYDSISSWTSRRPAIARAKGPNIHAKYV